MKTLYVLFTVFFLVVPAFVFAEVQDQDSGLALINAAEAGETALVKSLLDGGINIESKNRMGATALTLASIKGHLQVVQLLLDRGAAINAKTVTSITPLMAATSAGHTDVVRLLLDKGADVTIEDDDGDSALDMAEAEGNTVISELLESAEKDPRPTSPPVTAPAASVHKEVIREGDHPGGLTVRDSPSPSGRPIAYLSVGSTVTYAGQATNGQVKLSAPITGGWVTQKYLGSRTPEASVVRVDSPEQCLRVRSGPGTDHNKIGCLPRGAKLKLANSVQGDWVQIVTPMTGWVNIRQIEVPGMSPPKPASSGAQNVRERPRADSDIDVSTNFQRTDEYRPRYHGPLQGPWRRGIQIGPPGTGKGY